MVEQMEILIDMDDLIFYEVALEKRDDVSKTSGHNEILLEMDGVDEAIKPSFILISELPPTQLEIDIAAEFDIPIRFINKEKYQQVTTEYVGQNEYDYYHFGKKTVHKINEKKSTL